MMAQDPHGYKTMCCPIAGTMTNKYFLCQSFIGIGKLLNMREQSFLRHEKSRNRNTHLLSVREYCESWESNTSAYLIRAKLECDLQYRKKYIHRSWGNCWGKARASELSILRSQCSPSYLQVWFCFRVMIFIYDTAHLRDKQTQQHYSQIIPRYRLEPIMPSMWSAAGSPAVTLQWTLA